MSDAFEKFNFSGEGPLHPTRHLASAKSRWAVGSLRCSFQTIQFAISPEDVPVLVCHNRPALRNPSNAEVAKCLGFNTEIEQGRIYDLIVLGAGPAVYNGANQLTNVYMTRGGVAQNLAAGEKMKYDPGQMSDRLAFLYHHPTPAVRAASILAAYAIAYALFGNPPALRGFRARFRDNAMYRVRILLCSAIFLAFFVFFIFDLH